VSDELQVIALMRNPSNGRFVPEKLKKAMKEGGKMNPSHACDEEVLKRMTALWGLGVWSAKCT
jgi:hypothetical protein